ncbi:prepilin peptidase [Streptococcus marimammalium]|uniref:prepilin peptidase n=1 Tax=Streptococcus marimammalium TaxID=269666 RepID=UPI0003779888|nr:prepilin peptidase [Streptococcus marimammalium]
MNYFKKHWQHWQKGLTTKKTNLLKQKIGLLILLLGLVFSTLTYKWANITITSTHTTIISVSLLLSFYDIFYQEYPLIIWLFSTLGVLIAYPIKPIGIILFLIALLAEYRDIKIGSGDIFYLSTISLTMTFWQLSWLIQLSSLLGILVILFNNNKPIAFIPFLTLAYCLIL